MKRTGFKKAMPERKRQAAVPLALPVNCARADQVARCSVPVPKFAYTRSPALLKACRLIPCQHCGVSDGTVVACHSNWAEHGKGRSVKASDQFVAALCFTCHGALDQGSHLTRDQRRAMWQTAHQKTVDKLRRGGLWPDGVPVPEEETHAA